LYGKILKNHARGFSGMIGYLLMNLQIIFPLQFDARESFKDGIIYVKL